MSASSVDYDSAHYCKDGTDCQIGWKCPFSSVHGRLEEAHRHFHAAEAQYSDPRAFMTSLNAGIQSLRNVTFALQKKKALVMGFDQWYEPWQHVMKKDRILSWLHDARTMIVKQGDLETASVANVCTIDTYDQPVSTQFCFPPLETEESLASRLVADLQIPGSERKNRILRVERRWVASTLPEYELLDALAHGYAVLARLVAEVHRSPKARIDVAAAHPNELPGQKLDCMEVTGQTRVHLVRLDSGDGLEVRRTEVAARDKDAVDRAIAHYGGKRELEPFQLSKSQTFRERCETLFLGARRIIETDGYHNQIVMLETSGSISLGQVNATDKIDKLLLWRAVADEVRRLRARSVIAVGEVWVTKLDSSLPILSPSDDLNRGEALQLYGITASGETVGLRATIYRESGDVVLGPTAESSGGKASFLQPVIDVWKEMRLRSSISPNEPK